VNKVKVMMENVVRRGTAQNLYSENFSMAGKTGTCQKEYWKSSGNYISSFAGYFPADNPKYSCIVVIHKPNVAKGYYGNIVAGPVFKTIAQKIYATSPLIDKVNMPKTVPTRIQNSLDNYYTKVQSENKSMPDLRGMEAMDAVALLENLGARVATKGRGRVSLQSLAPGTTIRKNSNITLTLL
jgi:cell division protein FtsI (penicillin-binding protein 3)